MPSHSCFRRDILLKEEVMFRPFAKSLDLTLGRCPKCMHKAFLAALIAWVLTFVIIAFDGTFWLSALIAIAASSLTALWLAHISAFALRTAIAVGQSTRDLFPRKPAQPVAQAPFSRRKFAAEFARAAAFAAIATALATSANTVLAAGNCDCSKCRSDQKCCPTAGGYCGCFPGSISC